jgi:hypothetical protein
MRLSIKMLALAGGGLLSAGVGFAGVATAQGQSSLEQDYATLCANKPAPETETCAALKKALMAKVGTPSESPPAPNTPTTDATGGGAVAGALRTEETRRRWGIFADRVGKTYFNENKGFVSSVSTWSWKVPGEVLTVSNRAATRRAEFKSDKADTTEYHLDQARGGFYNLAYFGPALHVVQPDGSILFTNPDGKHRTLQRATGPNSWTSVTERCKNGVCKPIAYGTSHHTEMTPEFLASRRGGSSGGGLLGVVQGAVAGAAGMATGRGSMDAAIAGAAAGAVAGAAGVNSSSIQSGFRQGAAEVNASNAEWQRSFERSMAAAGAPGYANTATSTAPPTLTSSPSSGENPSAAEKLESRTVSAWFVVGMMPREKDTRNPLCVSNSIPVTIDYNPSGWGNDGRVLAALKPLESVFLEKCGRLGQVAGSINPMLDGSPNPHPDNYQVQVP